MPEYDEIYAALIKGGEVVNTIVVDLGEGWSDFEKELKQEYDRVIVVGAQERPSPGWKFDGQTWTAPTPEPIEESEPDELADDLEALRAKAPNVAAGRAQFTPQERDKVDALRLLGRI